MRISRGKMKFQALKYAKIITNCRMKLCADRFFAIFPPQIGKSRRARHNIWCDFAALYTSAMPLLCFSTNIPRNYCAFSTYNFT